MPIDHSTLLKALRDPTGQDEGTRRKIALKAAKVIELQDNYARLGRALTDALLQAAVAESRQHNGLPVVLYQMLKDLGLLESVEGQG